MNELKNRRYKEVEPKETVKRLKKILNEIGINVEENWSKKSSVDTYSLRVCVKGTNLGQNGKGMTKEFAMASGYAEFFERMQNGLLRFRIEKPTKELPFSIFPDEKEISIEELMEKPNSVLENILEANNYKSKTKEEQIKFIKEICNENCKIVENEKNLSLPYYSVKHKCIEYVPNMIFDYRYASNGMCAGNSPEEALVEGISEILERYVAFEILRKRLVLPEIPQNYIENFPKVKEMVEKLKRNEEYYFRLVDCSLGGKYPVAGLYILEKNTGRFGFKLGAHPDYEIAMERCFTEAAQGMDIYEYAQNCIFDFYEQDEKESKNITKFALSDMAGVPYQILGEETNFKFTQMPDVSNLDNKAILKKLVNNILEEGRDILIRDVSTLGFPTFRIAIPGMSEIGYDPNCKYLNLMNTMDILLKNFRNITLDNIEDVIKILETIIYEVGYEQLSIFINLKDNSMLPCEQIGLGAKYFLAIAYIMNEQYNEAAKILEDLNFLAQNIMQNPLEIITVKSVYYYASAMDKLKEHKKAMYYIGLLFSPEIVEAIDISFNDKSNIFMNHYAITPHDYPENDDVYYLPFMKKLREAQRDNVIDQIRNKEIFE